MCSENIQDISTFFCLWNEILAKEKKQEGYKFNPATFMCDSSGANFQAVRQVYRDLEPHCIVTCRWHFLHNTENSVKNVAQDQQDEFLQLCKQLAEVCTVPKYLKLKKKIDEVAEQNPDIASWVKWWHA